MRYLALTVVIATAATMRSAFGDVVYTSSFAEWTSLVPTYTNLSFVGLTPGTFLNDQYLDLGVDFTDGGMIQFGPITYPQDGFGIYGGCIVDMLLATPAYAIATHHPGSVHYTLFSGDLMVYEGPVDPDSGYNNFRGIVSSVAFDRVLMHGITLGPPACDPIAIDNIYFASIPAPGAVAIFVAFGCRTRRRKH